MADKTKSYLETAHKTLRLALESAKADNDKLAMEEIEMASNIIRGLY